MAALLPRTFLPGDVNISYKTARHCQHLVGVVPSGAQHKADVWGQTHLCAIGIESICAPGDTPLYANKK